MPKRRMIDADRLISDLKGYRSATERDGHADSLDWVIRRIELAHIGKQATSTTWRNPGWENRRDERTES
jgi:hypothetical protein